ncbi:serine/threonine-protein kinase PknG [Nocardia sp. CDC159]|uniref:non-specific serine/threonine protein kinase n=1 Tax=Nocardia pulmonis TaxID=2951408 RepID=A0A9X2E2K2_9NOCA|nr:MULTISPECIES: serine/threonine-protein kinase [Nocardia]MCM6773099.1 serine/threonine-protein kinase PknG [Nocardia pulmonis]MCM6785598.1 serine/threonine-protein kinase PknG [Nocardia sp. CDC159]
MTCGEPGCGGTIVDGYCEICGTAPAAAGSTDCREPGCGGTIVDGYCATCGTAPSAETATATTQSASTGRSTARSARTRSTSGRSRRGRLGAGMVEVPRVARTDPAAAVLSDPQVPENKRFCSTCERPVGRSREGAPGRTEGFCPHCGTRFSFSPKLTGGDLVGGQYRVAGPIAHGGLGWIYLATDTKVDDRWVVLKGLLNAGDRDAMAAAVAERRSLARVEHPNIVKIFNFVEHGGTDYLVMEYVGGVSLKQLLRRRRDTERSYLPPAQAIAYVLEMLPALGYLHSLGLAYCDFKPDNVMQTDEQLKLIDLGAVMAMDDEHGAIYGTAGYQAPEIADTGPTVASEIYTVGRTLAVLMMPVPQRDGHFAELPGPDTEPLLARHASLYRFLLRATESDPRARFTSTEEAADQLTGVLREVLAAEDDTPRPGPSVNFGPPRAVFGAGGRPPRDARAIVTALPVPLVDPADSGAALLATTGGTTVAELETAFEAGLRAVVTGKAESVEVPLRLVRAALEMGDAAQARRRIDELTPTLGEDWRLAWYRGQARLLTGEYDAAASDFESVYGALPGEAAPKLALAVAAELAAPGSGEPDAERRRAAGYYETVWRTDRGYVSAAFGLARLRRLGGERDGAVAALDQVQPSSALYTEARLTAVEVMLGADDSDRAPDDPEALAANITEELLRECGGRIEGLVIESKRRAAQVRLRLLRVALAWLAAGHTAARRDPLLGRDLDETGVRAGLERCYRDLARESEDMWERIELVERANAVRPRSTL